MRNGMAHYYYPTVKARQKDGSYMFIPGAVARDFIIRTGSSTRPAWPIGTDDKGQMVIATRNYTNELEAGVREFMRKTFEENDRSFQQSARDGILVMNYGQV